MWLPNNCKGMLQGPGTLSGDRRTTSQSVSASKAALGQVTMDVSSIPLEIFRFFCFCFSVDLFDLVIKETNLYTAAHPPAASLHVQAGAHGRFWDSSDHKNGGRPSYCEYWSTNSFLHHERIAKVMTRDHLTR
ncbi:uncharacterized protein LOC125032551 [Penaeus chinensis]|uniref:uncharacterized protein LOC125032551 n=1 Tax=Penaeus chinensis TaxID=139456 RepID=UPI001FB74BCB|nr:uncharacterized protein LOC125032551 [Penaeus chinensis]